MFVKTSDRGVPCFIRFCLFCEKSLEGTTAGACGQISTGGGRKGCGWHGRYSRAAYLRVTGDPGPILFDRSYLLEIGRAVKWLKGSDVSLIRTPNADLLDPWRRLTS